MIEIQTIEVNHFQVNCYILYDEATHQCAIVDPGAESNYEEAQVTQFIDEQGLTPTMILLTHAHVDHIAGLKQMCERYKLPVTLHSDGAKLLSQAAAYGSVMGFEVESLSGLPTQYITEGEILSLGESKIECRYVPGHCPGSICYVMHAEKKVLTGDAIFHFSIGRTDLPGGDGALLIERLKSQILTLDDEYEILPGHGIPSKVWKEKKYNPFLIGDF